MSVAQVPPGATWQVKLPTPPWSRAQVRPVQQASKAPQGEPNLGQQTLPVEPGRVEQSAVLWHCAALAQAVPSVLPHLPELVSQVRDWPEQHWSVRVHCATPGAGVPEFVQSRQAAQTKVPVAAASLQVSGEQQRDVKLPAVQVPPRLVQQTPGVGGAAPAQVPLAQSAFARQGWPSEVLPGDGWQSPPLQTSVLQQSASPEQAEAKAPQWQVLPEQVRRFGLWQQSEVVSQRSPEPPHAPYWQLPSAQ